MEIIETRADINDNEKNQIKINETKSWLFERTMKLIIFWTN